MEKMGLTLMAECKTVTPMLASGADQQAFEIRAAEIKSGLRFWWRAFQPDRGTKLAGREADLFGSTEGACPFRLRVKFQPNCQEIWQPGTEVDWHPGLQYFLYPVYDRGSKKMERKPGIKPPVGKNPGRPVAKPKPGQKFRLSITFKAFRQDTTREMAKDILRALWLLENLGGIGGRTRRGAGCFEITSLSVDGTEIGELTKSGNEWNDLPSFFFATGQTPSDFVKSGLDSVTKKWGCKKAKTADELDYTTFCPGVSEIWVVWSAKSSEKAIDIMSKIGEAMQSRRKKQPSVEATKMHESIGAAVKYPHSATIKPDLKTITKAALGMPIIYNFHQKPGDQKSPPLKITINGREIRATFTARGGYRKPPDIKIIKGSERRASPLLISCHEKGGRAYAVLCHFPAQLLPPGEKLYLEANYRNDVIGELYPVPGHEFTKTVMEDIYDYDKFEEKCRKKIFTSDPSSSPATVRHPVPPSTSSSSPVPVGRTVKPVTSARGPMDILRDPAFASAGYTLARLLDSPDTKERHCRCARLSLKADGTLSEEKGWTVNSKEIRHLAGTKKNDLFKGKQNPQAPRRLNELEKI